MNIKIAKKGSGTCDLAAAYPDADHDAWSETYDNPELWEWLMEQHK